MGCCSSNQEEVKQPRGAEGGRDQNRPVRNNARVPGVRVNNQVPSNPYWGTIDKIENIIPDSYVGEGIKRTEAFTIDLTEDQYFKWKDQFWETRCEGLEWVWNIIKEAVDLDSKDAEAYLINKGVTIDPRKGIKMLYDDKGRSYELPAAIINEPVGFGEDQEQVMLDHKVKPAESTVLNLVLRNASTFKDDKIEIKDTWSVKKLKERYADVKDWDDIKKIRLLYYGKELKDSYFLYHYEINEQIILISIINDHLFDE